MTDEEKLIKMFEKVHGDQSESVCYVKVAEECGEAVVHLMKHGNICWSVTKSDLLFDYITSRVFFYQQD